MLDVGVGFPFFENDSRKRLNMEMIEQDHVGEVIINV